MISKTVLILALCSQAVTAFGRTAFVLCVHESGRTQIEFSASPCCAELETCECAHKEEGSAVTTLCTCGDPCSDYPLPISEARLHAGSERLTLAAGLEHVNELSSLVATFSSTVPFGRETVPLFVSAPAGTDTVALLRTVVLIV